MKDANIIVENLCASYTKTPVLKNIQFKVFCGEKIALIGANGCGKTTLLRTLAGIVNYTGSISFLNKNRQDNYIERRNLSSREAALYTALVTQISPPSFSFTVEQTVLLGRYAHMKKGRWGSISNTLGEEDFRLVQNAMRTTEIQELAHKKLETLSGGQLQRVFLARSFAQDPDILLLDEPTNHLDLHHQIGLLEYLNTWISSDIHKKRSIIGVFHDLSLALSFADRIILLEDGILSKMGESKEIVKSDEINRAYGLNVSKTMLNLLQNW